MLFVVSPAKSLNFEAGPVSAPLTTPRFREDVAELSKSTRRLRLADLKRMMSISDDLARLNRDRFQAFDPESEDGLQAAFAFNGDVYRGLDARTLDRKGLAWAQDHVRILSGLYGLLRPADAIQPYRLEMGVRLKTRRGKSLYDFWGGRIAGQLNEDAAGMADPTLVNLASQEYFAAVDRKALALPVVTCHFREETGASAQMISFYAKKARGMMARFAIDRRAERVDDLKAFDTEGYRFDPALSSQTDWVFTRPKPPPLTRRR